MEDLETHDLPGSVGALRRALLIMHAPLDAIVGIDNASALFGAARHPKSFVSLDDADHLLGRERDARYAGRTLAAWASAYLPAPAADEPLAGSGDEVVARTGRDGLCTDVVAAGHPLVADEPAALGGTGLGPTPYDLLAAALATCTSMTLRMYADRKQLDLESATVRVAHGKVHAKDCADCESADGRVDEFRRVLSFEGTLTDAERRRLADIADRCPVHRTLHGEVRVRTTLDD
jgi:putative redox protein